MINGILCAYDNTRGKWLSVHREVLCFGRRGRSRRQYLAYAAGSLASNNSGYRIMRNATIVGISAQLDASGTCDIYIRKNDATSNIATLSITSSLGSQDVGLNVDIAQTDFLQSYINAPGSGVQDPMVLIEVAWRF